MVSGTLAPLYIVFRLKLGCSGAAAPMGDEVLKNGEIFYPSFRPSIRFPLEGPRASLAGLRPSESGLRANQAGLTASEA